MASVQPDSEPVPIDGSVPVTALTGLADRPLSAYLHIPFCTSRCGYCDFNTYSADQLPGVGIEAYLLGLRAEIGLARRVLGTQAPTLDTVFVGGGTPSVLTAVQLGGLLTELRDCFGLAANCEVTSEANPESLDERKLEGLLAAGFNRLSLGMQSSSPAVLKVLERRHTPGRALEMARLARRVGFENISLDLIYGTPGETMDQWRASLEDALSVQPDHVSAYALIVEDGTRLKRQIVHGRLPMIDDDDLADKYLLAEEVLTSAGFQAYEISNWTRDSRFRARHNLAYWRGDNWWGFGPGAHSHLNGVRWWNVLHPRSYLERLAEGSSPGLAREALDPVAAHEERVLLELRLADGLPLDVLTRTEATRVPALVADGLARLGGDRLVLTLRGRLLADAVTLQLLD